MLLCDDTRKVIAHDHSLIITTTTRFDEPRGSAVNLRVPRKYKDADGSGATARWIMRLPALINIYFPPLQLLARIWRQPIQHSHTHFDAPGHFFVRRSSEATAVPISPLLTSLAEFSASIEATRLRMLRHSRWRRACREGAKVCSIRALAR